MSREEPEGKGNGVIRRRLAVRSGRNSGSRHGIAGGISGEAGLCPCPPGPHQVLSHHTSSSPSQIRGRLAQILRRCSSSCLVHQTLSRVPRSNHPIFPRKCWKYPALYLCSPTCIYFSTFFKVLLLYFVLLRVRTQDFQVLSLQNPYDLEAYLYQ